MVEANSNSDDKISITNEIICPQELAAQLQTAWIFSFDETDETKFQNLTSLKVQL